jgi:hypothetical protein
MFKFSSDAASIFRLRWVGYALIIFSILDNFDTVTPLQLMDAEWERQTIGIIVERTPVLLMGLGLVFNGEASRRKRPESVFLVVTSWVCLLLMVFFLALVPLGISSSVRVYNQRVQTINTQVQRELDQVKVSEARIQQAAPAQLQQLADQIQRNAQQSPQQPRPQFNLNNLDQFRQQLLAQIKDSRTQIQARSKQLQEVQQRTLFKDGFKWSLGALMVSIIFLMFWQSTAWARKGKTGRGVTPRPTPTSMQPALPPGTEAERIRTTDD